jgi:hypothetical protein
VNITAGVDFLGLYDYKINVNMGPILNSYGVRGVFLHVKALL